MFTYINNDQSESCQNINISGINKYKANDYGASWATSATIAADLLALFPEPINGDMAILRNTNGTDESRTYKYSGGAWEADATATIGNGTVTDAKLATDVKVGSLATLTTTETGSVVGAINELVTTAAGIGTLASLTTTAQTNLVAAINEVDASAAAAASVASSAASQASDAHALASTANSAVAAKVGVDDTATLTDKTLTTPIIASFYQDAGKTKLMTTPDTASDTLCAIAATQALTNKTLTAPVMASFYQDAGKTKLMTTPNTASDTLCAIAAEQALTNKTLTTPVMASFYQDAGKTKQITAPALTGYIAMSTAALTLAEVDVLDGVTPGTAAASKAVVLDASSKIDTIDITAPLINGVAVSASAAELNKCDGIPATAYQVVSEMRTFTETTGAGTYTATVSVPAGSIVLDVMFKNDALWTATTSATLNVGDGDDADGYFAGVDVKTAPAAATATVPTSISSLLEDTGSGAYKGLQKYSGTAQTITAAIVTVGAAGDAGRSRLLVTYTTPTATAASKS